MLTHPGFQSPPGLLHHLNQCTQDIFDDILVQTFQTHTSTKYIQLSTTLSNCELLQNNTQQNILYIRQSEKSSPSPRLRFFKKTPKTPNKPITIYPNGDPYNGQL